MADPRVGTNADPQAPFELEWLTSGVFAGFLQIYGIGGLSGTKYLDYLLSRREAEALYEQLGEALGGSAQAALLARMAALLRDWLAIWNAGTDPAPAFVAQHTIDLLAEYEAQKEAASD